MSHGPIGERLAFAVEAARRAGELTLRTFGDPAIHRDYKADGSEVTAADREAEDLLRRLIGERFPEDAVLGEEHGEAAGSSGYRWILDPVDGTTSFVHGVPLYGTLVAVERAGRALAGVIHMPALEETVYGSRGGGAWHVRRGSEPVPARVSATSSLERAMVLYTSHGVFRRAGAERVFDAIVRHAGQTRGWSDCYGHVLVATGRADAVIEPVIRAWDIAPISVILPEAGGRHTDWEGKEDIFSPNGVASNGAVHDELLRVIRAAGG